MQRTEHTAHYDKYWQTAKIQRTDTWSQVVDNYENTYLDQKEWPIEVQVMKRVTEIKQLFRLRAYLACVDLVDEKRRVEEFRESYAEMQQF